MLTYEESKSKISLLKSGDEMTFGTSSTIFTVEAISARFVLFKLGRGGYQEWSKEELIYLCRFLPEDCFVIK